ncbi:unnamed protein product [Arctia plantaginis]|uniref:Uncharacterized protein n=1 Tax=Arctia plantaginis TaxID=874455 RepID=A0A8S1BHK4_ARCPL|nr:unnamed protein product [Arctia plantaginis]
MKRYKRHKVKAEMPETSSSRTREQEDHDLAYYIHDRVELMHQVFSVLKYKELNAMAPSCVRNISVDDLQELCTEELLGISSKRLCSILDGAEPPSDTESSSQSATEQLETISLDSISSDEELLSQEKCKKKKHKHRDRNSKSKSKRKSSDVDNDEDAEKSKASRAGLTVLELLELQARARAIRAQLQQEQSKPVPESVAAQSTQSTKSQSSEDEVEIKEEPAEIVEISSDEEKPKIEELEKSNPHLKSPEMQSKTVTKRVNDLVITVPQQKTQKIKLNRNKTIPQETNTKNSTQDKGNAEKSKEIVNKGISKNTTNIDKPKDASKGKDISKTDKNKEKFKKSKKKRLSNVSDNDEITLQLSDTEKMDLLEDLDRKNYDNVSSDTSSGSESDKDVVKKSVRKHTDIQNGNTSKGSKDEIQNRERKISSDGRKSEDDTKETVDLKEDISVESENAEDDKSQDVETDSVETKETEAKENENSNSIIEDGNSQSTSHTDVEIVGEIKPDVAGNGTETIHDDDSTIQNDDSSLAAPTESSEIRSKSPSKVDEPASSQENIHQEELEKKENENDLSEGEISDRESSEVEAFDLKPEVVCISDEEEGKHKKKRKKKEKKSKKDKKNKKKDFRESSDQNFHEIVDCAKNPRITILVPFDLEREVVIHKKMTQDSTPCLLSKGLQKSTEPTKLSTVEIDLTTSEKSQDCSSGSKDIEIISASSDPAETPSDIDNQNIEDDSPNEVVEISDEVYELSDDSSNDDETETQNVLSKEPTAAEIEALSAKIDEIDRIDVITEEEIKEYEAKHEEDKAKTMSWKDRYLDSNKVKRVLNTSNILNALRKKNRQLKKRLEESKAETQGTDDLVPTAQDVQEETKEPEIAEGSIEHYNTLEGSTKFVDPVKEPPITDTLKKDAKQLLKMYKKLLKYNDMSRKKDPTKKKKKKKKEKKDKECEGGVKDKESQ